MNPTNSNQAIVELKACYARRQGLCQHRQALRDQHQAFSARFTRQHTALRPIPEEELDPLAQALSQLATDLTHLKAEEAQVNQELKTKVTALFEASLATGELHPYFRGLSEAGIKNYKRACELSSARVRSPCTPHSSPTRSFYGPACFPLSEATHSAPK